MLGALLSTLKSPPYGVSGSEGPTTSPDPAHEDAYTRGLLFPDQNHADPSAREQAVSGVSDGPGRIDLQSPQDIRIIIAQDSYPKAVLFDSNGTSLPLTSQSRGPNAYLDRSSPPSPARTAPSRQVPRRGELTQIQSFDDLGSHCGPPSMFGGAFERARRREPHMWQTVDTIEEDVSNGSEPGAELRLFLDCMFGHAPMSYRGDTTKLHVFPNDEKLNVRPTHTSPVIKEGSGSWGRAEGRRKSQLSRSFTPSDLSTGDLSMLPTSNYTAKSSDKRTVLLTRTFSVNLPDLIGPSRDEHEKKNPALPSASTDTPDSKDDDGCGRRRAPMYGVALVLQIPVSAQAQTTSYLDSSLRAGSFGSREPYSSSMEHETRSGWLFLDPGSGLTSSSASSIYSSDVDDVVDVITQRFDMATRALSAIQTAVRPKLRALLEQVPVSFSQGLLPHQTAQTRYLDAKKSPTGRLERSPAKNNQPKLVQLTPGALVADKDVKRLAESTAKRFATALRIPRVVTGQRRWETWRDEARWIERWGGRKEQNFFFFQLLTAFLGNHTEWLNIIGPSWYRRRHEHLQTAGLRDDCAMTSRTVIVGNNKLAARRLVFLLTSFLPATSASLDISNFGGGFRPSSSTSHPHPTTTASPSRRGSLRRTVNKKAGIRQVDPDNSEVGEGVGSPLRGGEGRLINVKASLTVSRDPHSVRTASLPIPQSNTATRKSSATTIATITPATTIPRFTSHQVDHSSVTNSEEAPNSGGSLASLNLIHTLRKNDSTEHSHASSESQSGSRWGSLISGFWSNRRDSTDDSDYTMPPDEVNAATSGWRLRKSRSQSGGKLAHMVRQTAQQDETEHLSPTSHYAPRHFSPTPVEMVSATNSVPGKKRSQQPTVPDSTLKLSVDEKDGVVDVELPLPHFFSSSYDSPGHSPATSGFMSAASFEEASSGHSQFMAFPYQRLDVSTPVNVAGWLRRYHPDFALQAVSRYPQLMNDIKQSMSGEATPTQSFIVRMDEETKEKWVNVCSTLIADTDTFTVTRLRLFRRARSYLGARSSSAGELDGSGKSLASLDRSRVGEQPASTDAEADEYFTEEPVFDMDNTLIDAVEHILARSSYTNNPTSAATSRPTSRQRSRTNTGVSNATPFEDLIPKEDCERIVLGALDQVVKSVVVEQDRDGDGGTGQSPSVRAVAAKMKGQGRDSSLREGIRKWLYDIEAVTEIHSNRVSRAEDERRRTNHHGNG
ncbi:MAG: hypothetical protein M1816_000697 [Peltula sp. TS41687]|nr:MAG: hypothetical protein M1816_000697 [Peltula sp. TS41687]